MLGQFRLRLGQRALEVRQCLSLPAVEPAFDLMHEHVAGPPVLDGLVCGGFFMVRDHPANHFAADMLAFMKAHLPEQINSMEAARRALNATALDELENLLRRYRVLSPAGDPIARIREAVHPGLTSKLPRLQEVSFSDADNLAAKLQRFVEEPKLRRHIADDQRRFVERYFTYESNMRRVIGTIRERIASEPQQMQAAA